MDEFYLPKRVNLVQGRKEYILQYADYATCDDLPAFQRNRTGYGYVVMDVATALANAIPQKKIRLITFNCLTPKLIWRGVDLCEHTFRSAFDCFRLRHLVQGCRNALTALPNLHQAKRILVAHIFLGEVERHIDDAIGVHVHGAGPVSLPVIRLALRRGKKVIVTLHGLNSMGAESSADVITKDCEREVIALWRNSKVVLTVLTERARKQVLNDQKGCTALPEVYVIRNGIGENQWDLTRREPSSLRSQLGIETGVAVGLCVGHLSLNKNQYQVVRAFAETEPAKRPDVVILFLGDTGGDQRVANLINQAGLNRYFRIVGPVLRKDVWKYYEASNFTLTLSVSEGYGIPIIEGYQFGLPAVAFADLDAIPEIYNEVAMLVVPTREDQDLLETISTVIKSRWDSSGIKLHGAKYLLNESACRYAKLYEDTFATE